MQFFPCGTLHNLQVAVSGNLQETAAEPAPLRNPSDLICTASGACGQAQPSFFIDAVLVGLHSEVRDAPGATPRKIDELGFAYDWVTTGSGQYEQLFLRIIQRTGYKPGSAVTETDVRFESASLLANRKELRILGHAAWDWAAGFTLNMSEGINCFI